MAIGRWRSTMLLVVAGVSLSSIAFAAPPSDQAGLLRAGAEAASQKRWEACMEALAAAAKLEDDPKT